MINENIKKYRKKRGLTQAEMAKQLHVVRQTVSKWESGKSVPDADVIVKMAELLDIPASTLLGTETGDGHVGNLTSKRDDLNRLILFLSFVSMFIALSIKNTIISIVLSGGCILLAVIVLYRNLALLTDSAINDTNRKVLRITTLFNIVLLIVSTLLAALTAADILTFSGSNEKILTMLIVICIMIFAGIVSPKLPFTRHTGLRLPWTIRDKDTWDLAHTIIGYISLPLALLYIACAMTIDDFEKVTLVIMLLWIGIPGGISYIFFRRKYKGKPS